MIDTLINSMFSPKRKKLSTPKKVKSTWKSTKQLGVSHHASADSHRYDEDIPLSLGGQAGDTLALLDTLVADDDDKKEQSTSTSTPKRKSAKPKMTKKRTSAKKRNNNTADSSFLDALSPRTKSQALQKRNSWMHMSPAQLKRQCTKMHIGKRLPANAKKLEMVSCLMEAEFGSGGGLERASTE